MAHHHLTGQPLLYTVHESVAQKRPEQFRKHQLGSIIHQVRSRYVCDIYQVLYTRYTAVRCDIICEHRSNKTQVSARVPCASLPIHIYSYDII